MRLMAIVYPDGVVIQVNEHRRGRAREQRLRARGGGRTVALALAIPRR